MTVGENCDDGREFRKLISGGIVGVLRAIAGLRFAGKSLRLHGERVQGAWILQVLANSAEAIHDS